MTADHMAEQNPDTDPDVVAYTLQMVVSMAPQFSAALARQIEEQVKSKYGGRRYFLPKGAKRLTPQERLQVYQDGLTTMPDEDILKKHQISKTTLWRVMKTGPSRLT